MIEWAQKRLHEDYDSMTASRAPSRGGCSTFAADQVCTKVSLPEKIEASNASRFDSVTVKHFSRRAGRRCNSGTEYGCREITRISLR
jgi:hypothetical protein